MMERHLTIARIIVCCGPLLAWGWSPAPVGAQELVKLETIEVRFAGPGGGQAGASKADRPRGGAFDKTLPYDLVFRLKGSVPKGTKSVTAFVWDDAAKDACFQGHPMKKLATTRDQSFRLKECHWGRWESDGVEEATFTLEVGPLRPSGMFRTGRDYDFLFCFDLGEVTAPTSRRVCPTQKTADKKKKEVEKVKDQCPCEGDTTSSVSVHTLTLHRFRSPIRKGPAGTQPVTSVARDQAGIQIQNPTLKWTSDKPEVATVDATGNVTAVATGKARIIARAYQPVHGEEDVADTMEVTVAAPPATAPRYVVQGRVHTTFRDNLTADVQIGSAPRLRDRQFFAIVGVHLHHAFNDQVSPWAYGFEDWVRANVSLFAGLAITPASSDETRYSDPFAFGSPVAGLGLRLLRTVRLNLGWLFFERRVADGVDFEKGLRKTEGEITPEFFLSLAVDGSMVGELGKAAARIFTP